jgi:hypothetical protein
MEIGASGDRETKTIATRRNGGSGGRSGDQVIGKTKAYRGLARMSADRELPLISTEDTDRKGAL